MPARMATRPTSRVHPCQRQRKTSPAVIAIIDGSGGEAMAARAPGKAAMVAAIFTTASSPAPIS